MAKTNLNFHQTFKPERQYLSSLLAEIERCNGLDVQGISNQTGIPTGISSGKVEPSICYAEYMGLVTKEKKDGKYFLSYTSLGKHINEEDAGFLEKLSLLAMHCMLVRPFSGAEMWAHVFHGIFPKYRNQMTSKQFDKEIEIQFGSGIKMAPFSGCYQELFASLGLIAIRDDTVKLCSSKIDSDFVYLYAFILYTYWDEWIANAPSNLTSLASASEITADHLKQIGFRNPFGWDEKEEYQVLELLASKQLIALNRQMVPFTVRRTVELEMILDNLYSELC